MSPPIYRFSHYIFCLKFAHKSNIHLKKQNFAGISVKKSSLHTSPTERDANLLKGCLDP